MRGADARSTSRSSSRSWGVEAWSSEREQVFISRILLLERLQNLLVAAAVATKEIYLARLGTSANLLGESTGNAGKRGLVRSPSQYIFTLCVRVWFEISLMQPTRLKTCKF
jgi:hypothetical protein